MVARLLISSPLPAFSALYSSNRARGGEGRISPAKFDFARHFQEQPGSPATLVGTSLLLVSPK